MNSAPIPSELCALAPDLALRLGQIFDGLRTVIAARFLRIPHLVLFTVTLHNRLGRAARRFERLMARLAAGRLPAPRAARTGHTGQAGAPKPALPSARGWLLHELRHEAAVYANRLERLLAEPGIAELLAATPSAGRILRPLCHMLGIRSQALPPRPSPARARPRKPRARPSDRAAGERPESGTASLHPIARAATPPARPERPPPSRPAAPLCPRLELRWPWNALPTTKPA